MKDKLLNDRAISPLCLYINTLPECPRCIGGHLQADNLIDEVSCFNCGYYPWELCYKHRKNGHKRLSACLPLDTLRPSRTYSTKKERRWRNKMIVGMKKKGYTNEEIAFELDISKGHVGLLYKKAKMHHN